MAKSWEQITNTMSQRRRADQPLIRRMVDTRDHANGDITIPLVDVMGTPEMNVLMPFLVSDGVEGTAMRAAGPMPNIHTPALDPTKERGKGSLEYAAIRRRALYARWHRARLPLLLGRAYRQLVAYGTFAMVVTPDFDNGGACIELRDVLGAYPALRGAEEVREPTDVGFVFGRSPAWILENWPEATEMIGTWTNRHPEEQLWDMVEWIDTDNIVIGILGPRSVYTAIGAPESVSGMELRRWPNRAGMVTAVVPRRVTLDRVAGQLEKIVPMEEWAAKLMALDFVAAERGVFPDLVVIGAEGRTPQIIGNNGWRDGRTGDPNLLQGVQAVQQLQSAPGPMTQQTLDRIIGSARVSGGVSPFFGGETTGSLRTGRAIGELGGYSVDPRIQELQQIMSYALETINRQICATETGYFPNEKFTVFSGWPSDRGSVEYTPSKHFETQDNAVSYVFPGSDVSAITIAVGQLNGAKLMSRHTARDKHPLIEDAQQEEMLLAEEGINDAVMAAMQTQIAQGQMSWQAVASIGKKIAAGMPWPQAIIEVGLEEQQRQAQAAQQQAMAAQQGGAPGPGGQPGLGGGALPTQGPPEQGVTNVASMVRALSAGTRGQVGVQG